MKDKEKILMKVGVLILFFICIVYYFNNKEDKLGYGISDYSVQVGTEPGLTREIVRERAKKEMYDMLMSFNLENTAIAQDENLNIIFANPDYNRHYLVLEIELDDEVIVRTEKIAPDRYIESIKLEKALPKGEYRATSKVIGYNKDTGEIIGEVIDEIRIISE